MPTPIPAAPRVSVMMPAYNAEPFIGQAIQSLLAQSLAGWELVVVDDGSTDGTGRVARSFGDPRIRVFHRANGGEAAARNTALEHLHGEYVAFLDADDVYLPGHLEVAVGHLEAHPEHAGVFSDGYHVDEDLRHLAPLSARRRAPRSGDVLEEIVLGSDYLGPPLCVVLRLDPIRRHQLTFDEGIGLGTDWDFFARVAETGGFGYLDQITCLYRLHEENLTTHVGSDQRRLGYTKCRMKAIRRPSFARCGLDVRLAVFYDLLVNLLRPQPDLQAEVVQWEAFMALPRKQRARLFRLMATKAILHDMPVQVVRGWLDTSLALDPRDLRARAVDLGYGLSPSLCRLLLGVRARNESDSLVSAPFADVRSR